MGIVESGVAEIKLNNGRVAIVDAEDEEYLSQWNWNLIEYKGVRHAYTVLVATHPTSMHTLVMCRHGVERPPGLVVDHINGNGLDNRRQNLRVVTHADNCSNNRRRRQGKTTSRYKGVWFEKCGKRKKRWRSKIRSNNTCRHLGSFITEEEAAVAYDAAAKELYGEYYIPNMTE